MCKETRLCIVVNKLNYEPLKTDGVASRPRDFFATHFKKVWLCGRINTALSKAI